jgi:vacuolar-type H+-ATPase subunit I/STV1
MTSLNILLPLTSSIISFFLAYLLFRRYLARKGPHLLLWGIGMVFYGIGGFSEAYFGALGWNVLIFRLWYLCGALLVAAWLGQGTVYLLVRRRWANVLMVVLALASLYGAFRVFAAQLDPVLMTASVHTGSELSGSAIVTPGVRSLTPFFNLYGTVTLVGGALYSAWIFWRKRVLLHRTIGNILIATGAILPAFGGTFSRMGMPNALYLSELLGAILLTFGFLRALTPMGESLWQTVKEPAARRHGAHSAGSEPES